MKAANAKRGQFIILGTLVMVVSLLFIMAAYSFASIYKVKLVREDFRETVFKISSDLQMALEASTAGASKRWRHGYVDYQQYGNDILLNWISTVIKEYSGLGLHLNVTHPVEFKLEQLVYSGRTSANVSMSLYLTKHGFYGWRDKILVENRLWVNSSSIGRIGDYIFYRFTILREGGQPVTELTSRHITLYMVEERALIKYVDPANMTLTYLGGGEYLLNVSTGTLDIILDNLEVLYYMVKDYPEDYFKEAEYKNQTLENINRTVDYVKDDKWIEADGAYHQLLNISFCLNPIYENSWVVEDADTSAALMIIDETLTYMLPTFEFIVYDERGIVTKCFVAFEEAEDAIGPVARELQIIPEIAQKGVDTMVTLRALIDDSETGNSLIAAAEFFMDEEGVYGTGTPMDPEDGFFNSPIEWVYSSINIADWDVGDYVFLVHGKDEHGNWGKITIIILRIRDLLPPTIGDAEFYLNQTLYPEPYTDENGTLGAAELSVNVTNVSDVGRGDSIIIAVKCRLYNNTYSTDWVLLNPEDGAYDEPRENAAGTISIAHLAPGIYTLHIRVTDSYENHNHAYFTVNVTRDWIGPPILHAVLYNSTHQGDVIVTYGEPVHLNATAEDIGNAGYYVQTIRALLKNSLTGVEVTGWIELSPSDGFFDERSEDATGIIHVHLLPPGNYTVVVQAVDSGGNPGANHTALTIVRVEDVFGPVISSLAAELDPVSRALNVTALVSDLGRGSSDIALAQCKLYNDTYETGWLNMTASDGAYDEPEEWVNATINVSALSPGVYMVEVGALDSAGNKAENKTIQVVVDFEPPVIYAEEWIYKPALKLLSVEANVSDVDHGGSNITSARCRLYNETYSTDWFDMDAVEGVYGESSEVRVNGTINLTGLISGNYTLEVEGYDSANNRGSLTVEDLWLDLEPPHILNLTAHYDPLLNTINVTAFISDLDRGGSNITAAYVRVTGLTIDTGWLDMDAVDGAYDEPEEWVEKLIDATGWPPGFYTVEVEALDSAGNAGNSTITVMVGRWLIGWRYRKSHEILGSTAGAVTDYQVKITVHYGSGVDSGEHVYLNGKCRADFGDIRFTDSDGETELAYWMEEKVDSDYAVFWVKVPSIPASPNSTIIYIYYGRSDATSVSDGDGTFIFFDDFESGALNPAKWTVSHSSRAGVGTHTSKSGLYSMYTRWGYVTVRSASRDLSGLPGVKFHTWIRRGSDEFSEDPDQNEDLQIGYLNSGGTWVLLETFLGDGTPGEIFEREWTLPADALHSGFRIMFWQTSGSGSDYDYWHVDDVFLRSYIDPEPTHGGWGSEEVAPS